MNNKEWSGWHLYSGLTEMGSTAVVAALPVKPVNMSQLTARGNVVVTGHLWIISM